jgi:hypothetical protein
MKRIIRALRPVPIAFAVALAWAFTAPTANADNSRFNNSVVANVFTIQHQAGCTNDVRINPQLRLAAQSHTLDVLNNRNLDGDIGSDGSTTQDRANAAGYQGQVAETVAINPAVAISGVELMNQRYYNPPYMAIMSNCANTQIGVWSENSLDRTVVVAMYGPKVPDDNHLLGPELGLAPPVLLQQDVPLDPAPDYDGTGEIEYFFNWFPWILRGAYPPPAYPPN